MNTEQQKGRRLSRILRLRQKFSSSEEPLIKIDKIPTKDESLIMKGYGLKDRPRGIKKQ